MDLQKVLASNLIRLEPLKESDFEQLFEIASDPLIWEQHPNSDRYLREPFLKYFNSGIDSKGAFLIYDAKKNSLIGCTRFYDYNEADKSVAIGYTFISRAYWGIGINAEIKKLMIDYALQHVEKVYFHVGLRNIRSQKAVEKLGAVMVEESDKITYLLSSE